MKPWPSFALVAMVAACAGRVGEIDRVQPGYVTKAELLGSTWYYRRTVVEQPATHELSWAGIGMGDLFALERVRWVVQEQYLYAVRDQELVPGTEGAAGDPSGYTGAPLAAFRIDSHFDIGWQYDSSTGEKSNVRVENTTDRPWSERAHMHVDWSRNDSPTLGLLLPLDVAPRAAGDGWCDATDFVQDPDCVHAGDATWFTHADAATSPWRARLTPERGYLDFVTTHLVRTDLESCVFLFDFASDPTRCGAGELRVRHAFMRVDEAANAGYQPLDYPDSVVLHDDAGAEVHDPATGEVAREPVFDRFGFFRLDRLTYDRERELTEKGRIHRILRRQLWQRDVDEAGRVIPYAAREPRPVVYHLNAEFPADLRDAAREVEAAWDDALRTTVASLQGVDKASLPAMFVLRDNDCSVDGVSLYLAAHPDVRAAAAASMGEAATTAAVSQRLVNWCAATEYHSRQLTDPFTWQQMGDPRFSLLEWVPGVVPGGWSGLGPAFADPTNGRVFSGTAYVMGWRIDQATSRALDVIDYINGNLSLEDVLMGVHGDAAAVTAAAPAPGALVDPLTAQAQARALPAAAFVDGLSARVRALGSSPAALMKRVDDSGYFAERLGRLAGGATEAEWLTTQEELAVATGGLWKPGAPVTAELLRRASGAARKVSALTRRHLADTFLRERTLCDLETDLDPTLVGLASRLAGLPRAEQRRTLRAAAFTFVALHELGHNLGLRHNFEATYDALNYFDDYWRLERAYPGTGAGDAQAKLAARQPAAAYSSVMDYHWTTVDLHGLGKYDYAAIKFGYGQLLETFGHDVPAGGRDLRAWRYRHDYHELPAYVGDPGDRRDVTFDWTLPGLRLSDVRALTRNEVPYLACFDEHEGVLPTCRAFDFGASLREVTRYDSLRLQNYRIFWAFLRDRLVLDTQAVQGYAARFFLQTLTTYQYWYLEQARDPTFATTAQAADMIGAFADGFNVMHAVLSMPEAGEHIACVSRAGAPDEQVVYYPATRVGTDWVTGELVAVDRGEVCDPTRRLLVPIGQGMPIFIGLSDGFVDWTLAYLGSYYDKDLALLVFAWPLATYLRADATAAPETFAVGAYRVFGPELLDLFGRLLRGDFAAVGGTVNDADLDALGRPRGGLSPPVLVDPTRPLPVDGPPPSSPAGVPRVVPALATTLQRWALLYGDALMSTPLDEALDFGVHARVVLKGGPDDLAAFDAADPSGRAECVLPDSGITYRALATADGRSIGFGLVQDCAGLAARVAAARGSLPGLAQALASARSALDATDPADAPAVAAARAAVTAAQQALALGERELDLAGGDLLRVEQLLEFARLMIGTYELGFL